MSACFATFLMQRNKHSCLHSQVLFAAMYWCTCLTYHSDSYWNVTASPALTNMASHKQASKSQVFKAIQWTALNISCRLWRKNYEIQRRQLLGSAGRHSYNEEDTSPGCCQGDGLLGLYCIVWRVPDHCDDCPGCNWSWCHAPRHSTAQLSKHRELQGGVWPPQAELPMLLRWCSSE